MRRAVNIIIGVLFMGMLSLIFLLVLSILTYSFHWQADKALLGITLIYILAGLGGGLAMKWVLPLWWKKRKDTVQLEWMSVGLVEKMLESILAGTLFMVLLVVLSFFASTMEIELSTRLLIIWMLLTGSTALGRIL